MKINQVQVNQQFVMPPHNINPPQTQIIIPHTVNTLSQEVINITPVQAPHINNYNCLGQTQYPQKNTQSLKEQITLPQGIQNYNEYVEKQQKDSEVKEYQLDIGVDINNSKLKSLQEMPDYSKIVPEKKELAIDVEEFEQKIEYLSESKYNEFKKHTTNLKEKIKNASSSEDIQACKKYTNVLHKKITEAININTLTKILNEYPETYDDLWPLDQHSIKMIAEKQNYHITIQDTEGSILYDFKPEKRIDKAFTLIYKQATDINGIGHYSLLGDKLENIGKNTCAYDAISHATGMSIAEICVKAELHHNIILDTSEIDREGRKVQIFDLEEVLKEIQNIISGGVGISSLTKVDGKVILTTYRGNKYTTLETLQTEGETSKFLKLNLEDQQSVKKEVTRLEHLADTTPKTNYISTTINQNKALHYANNESKVFKIKIPVKVPKGIEFNNSGAIDLQQTLSHLEPHDFLRGPGVHNQNLKAYSYNGGIRYKQINNQQQEIDLNASDIVLWEDKHGNYHVPIIGDDPYKNCVFDFTFTKIGEQMAEKTPDNNTFPRKNNNGTTSYLSRAEVIRSGENNYEVLIKGSIDKNSYI